MENRKASISIKDKVILSIGAPITDNAYQKEKILLAESKAALRNKNNQADLFDPNWNYVIGDTPIEQSIYNRVIQKIDRVQRGLHHRDGWRPPPCSGSDVSDGSDGCCVTANHQT